MYLVSADHYHRGTNYAALSSPRERKKRSGGSSSRLKKQKGHSYEEWIKKRHKIRGVSIRRKTQTKAISDFQKTSNARHDKF